jgi:hypothetical protein
MSFSDHTLATHFVKLAYIYVELKHNFYIAKIYKGEYTGHQSILPQGFGALVPTSDNP